jgi:hypothetical protein
MSFSRRPTPDWSPALVLALMGALSGGCDGGAGAAETGGGGSGGAGASGGAGGGGTGGDAMGGSGTGGDATGGSGGEGGASGCWQAETMLDVSQAVGAGPGYPAPQLAAKCEGGQLVVDGNGIPHYTFVQTTPNPLQAADVHYAITLNPQAAAQVTTLPLLGPVGFAVNGMHFFGPNEAAQPADEAYGDPIYNGLMDACLGHTAMAYHYHALDVKCLNQASLVAEPWMNADPPAGEASPVIGWGRDGFPIRGPLECSDAGCAAIVEMKSSYVLIGDPKTNAWDAYEYQANADPTFLDECNGHTGPDGDYHYHATAGFPYILGCFRGTPAAMGPGGP